MSYTKERRKYVRDRSISVSLGKLIRVTPGQRHAWYESNVGPVRKQVSVYYSPEKGEDIVTLINN